jgi:hypothetical protein
MRPLLALAAAGGLACLTQGAIAAPIDVPTNPHVHQAYYGYGYDYCGPECQRHRYWAHRRWERRRWAREHQRYYSHSHYPNYYYHY